MNPRFAPQFCSSYLRPGSRGVAGGRLLCPQSLRGLAQAEDLAGSWGPTCTLWSSAFPAFPGRRWAHLALPIKQQIQRGQKGLPRVSGVHLQETLEERLRDSLGRGAQIQAWELRVPRAICSNPCSPLSEAQHLSSRISLYSPVGRHPDKFYTPLGFSIFSSAPQTPKASITTTFLILPLPRLWLSTY